MGLIDGLFKQAVPNSTKCATWQDIKTSHLTKDPKTVLQLEDIFGMVVLLMIGINLAILTFFAERAMIRKRP